MSEMQEPNFLDVDRRVFMRSMFGVSVGAIVGAAVMPPAGVAASIVASKVTDSEVGNAGYREMIKEECAPTKDPEACRKTWQPTPAETFSSVVAAPIMEEFMFRAIPSAMLDVCSSTSHGKDEAPMDVLARGTDARTFSRAELFAGMLSSLTFGAVHNATAKGYDTKTVPAPQTVGGMILWGLARKFGMGSSIAAHMSYNGFLTAATRLRK